ncbi:GPI ethanolamine phosphate transferase 3 isoform X1 [Schistocerca americana]|uniref:GPI ethanolamine phosphate transferase 3 isoform X1 n=1 Tax=Schistocerca americana TaxID=7009 RepID=UPI001F4F98BF|nr:GPI ethanolamine phosphate transferase 3 isoform X1 [Schistocerca americana]
MERAWKYFILLIWFSYLLVTGILLFGRGFLLTRESLFRNDSTKPSTICDLYVTKDRVDSLSHSSNEETFTDQCTAQYESISAVNSFKVILIVIDALKFDFVSYDENAQETPFKNKLTVIRDLLKEKPERTRLYKFIADPPTTTMQRLKGMTTGSLPTFIDIGSNFATPEINEDNIIDQLKRHNRSIVFMGDDTWSGLYPGRFLREYAYPSFNVWDLDTVDSGIQTHLLPEIRKQDWHLIISHFLGVDHCGHRYGPHHPEMARKLKEMNHVISDVVNTMDNNTILLVVGDHGMTNTGDHGGDSEAEVTAALFVYSSVPLVPSSMVPYSSVVSQVDLVPTLSTILDVDIPFPNLGTVILDALPSLSTNSRSFPEWKTLLWYLWKNVEQASHYIQQYSNESNQLPKEKLDILDEKYIYLVQKVKSVDCEESFKNFAQLAKDYLIFLKEMCKEVWVHFDPLSMSRGLIVTFLTLFFSYLLVDGLPGNLLIDVISDAFLIVMCFALGLATVGVLFSDSFNAIENLEQDIYFFMGCISLFFMCVIIIQNWASITKHWYNQQKLNDIPSIFARFLLICGLFSVFSNSFVVEEATVVSYFVTSLIWIILYEFKSPRQSQTLTVKSSFSKLHLSPSRLKILSLAAILTIMIRLSHYYWRCREEQVNCGPFITHKSPASATVGNKYRNAECLFTVGCLAAFVTVARLWLRSCGNLAAYSTTVTLFKYCPNLIVVSTGGFWVLQSLPRDTKNNVFFPWHLQVLPWFIFTLIIAAVFSLCVEPLCVYLVPKKKEKIISFYGQENVIPNLFKHVRSMIRENKMNGSVNSDQINSTENFPVVYGLATVYSAAFVVLTVFVSLLAALLHGDVLAPSLVLMVSTAAGVLAMLSVGQFEKSQTAAHLFIVPWSSVICWGFLSVTFFYATGHQPAFSTIQWNAAFVGTTGQLSNHIIPGLLIVINTFTSHLIFGLMLPLLLIAPFTLLVMLPKFAAAKNNLKEDANQGELILLEKKNMMYQELFSLSVRYIMFHGIRVFACMLAATIHCRHLMVWKIFAPKLIFEALSFFVTIIGVCFGYLITLRITNKTEVLFKKFQRYFQ